MKALLIVDIQNDFTAGGALAVPQGEAIIDLVNKFQEKFPLVVATQDWHPKGHKSFASSHSGHRPFQQIKLNGLDQMLWPDHCVQGTRGAEFHADLKLEKVEAVFRKGMDPEIDSYSGFFDNGRRKSTGLSGYLKERKVSDVYVCGLAADYCVYFTAKDAQEAGFNTFFVEDLTRAISEEGFEAAKSVMRTNGIHILTSTDFK
jgi:nicotinamidase/pyrazinamidase